MLSQMKKIEEITQNLHRQQLREAKRLRNRLNYAAAKIQAAFQRHLSYVYETKRVAAVDIQRAARGFLARQLCSRLRIQLEDEYQEYSALVITSCIRKYACKNIRGREVKLRFWAACLIQSIVRMANSRSYVQALRRQRREAERQQQAAIVIQCNARSFMTRLIYLDVLYLICRIQAAMRGCLVRRQLRWLRAADVEAISRLQAHIRGFLVRREMQASQDGAVDCDSSRSTVADNNDTNSLQRGGELTNSDLRGAVGHSELGRATSFSCRSDDQPVKGIKRVLGRSSTGLTSTLIPEPVYKRSYWLPPGASFDRRLPVLPVAKRIIAFESTDFGGDDMQVMSHSRTPKKRPHQKPCPVRLSPVVIPSVPREPSPSIEEEESVVADIESRIRRQEELKQKLLKRKSQERRQLEHELRLKREAESEATERKLMEREEKSTRLQLKILRRRSREGKIRQVTSDQRREERERLAMAREERHVRLHLKFCARQQQKKRQQLATASTTASDSETRQLSAASTYRQGKTTTSKTAANTKDVDSEDDGDMSFLDIDFKVPASMKPRKQSKSGKLRSTSEHGSLRQPTKKKRLVKTSSKKRISVPPQPMQDQNDCEYGDEFEDMVDEAALGRLIC